MEGIHTENMKYLHQSSVWVSRPLMLDISKPRQNHDGDDNGDDANDVKISSTFVLDINKILKKYEVKKRTELCQQMRQMCTASLTQAPNNPVSN